MQSLQYLRGNLNQPEDSKDIPTEAPCRHSGALQSLGGMSTAHRQWQVKEPRPWEWSSQSRPPWTRRDGQAPADLELAGTVVSLKLRDDTASVPVRLLSPGFVGRETPADIHSLISGGPCVPRGPLC